MTDKNSNQGNDEEQSFADLLDSYSNGMNEDISVGDQIRGEIISVGKDTIYVDTGTKIDGVIEKNELIDKDGEFPHKVGDILELYVVSFDGNEIRLSKALTGVGNLRLLEEAFRNSIPVEGKVKAAVKGGFQVEISQRRAFCPISQMDLKYVENSDDYVGSSYPFMIIRFEENGRNIVVSRREILEKEQREVQKQFLSEIQAGSNVHGRVTKIMPYGAFIELLPGLEGMVHISELSWSRVEKPDEVVKVNDSVEVKVIEIEPGRKSASPKISLSLKQITEDPWNRVSETFQEGEKIKGTVKRCAAFGAFVEITPGIEGLVHISEMSYVKRIVKPEDVVAVGETVNVMIKEIDPENRRISLSMKDAEGDPWQDIEEKIKIGDAVEGTLEKTERFGYFVNLQPGITGLLPNSKIKSSQERASIEKLKPGDPIKVIVEEINVQEHKMTLGTSDLKEEGDWKKFSKNQSSPFGSFGDKLQQALNANKDGDPKDS